LRVAVCVYKKAVENVTKRKVGEMRSMIIVGMIFLKLWVIKLFPPKLNSSLLNF
jgi:hypothetical protein